MRRLWTGKCRARMVAIALARTPESTPCDSGVETAQPWVGHTVSASRLCKSATLAAGGSTAKATADGAISPAVSRVRSGEACEGAAQSTAAANDRTAAPQRHAVRG